MKKCKWCETQIPDDVVICPHCKANQNKTSGNNTSNRVGNYLETGKTKNPIQEDIHQMAQDIRYIKNLIKVSFILAIIFTILSVLVFPYI